MKDTIIRSVKATEVIVPPKPGSLNSESVHDTDVAFAKKFLTGGSWTEFAIQPKWILKMEQGAAIVPQGDGLGVLPDHSAIEKYKTGNSQVSSL